MLVGLGILCGGLFVVLNATVESVLENYLLSSDVLDIVIEERVNDLQDYVTENQVSATDSQAFPSGCGASP